MHFSKLYVWNIAFINMDINTAIIIIEQMRQNFEVFQFKIFV